LLGDRTEAEDCVQETFAIALERLADLRDGGALRGWLAQIAVSQVRRRYRKKKLLRFFGFGRDEDATPIEGFAWTGATPDVHAELAKLGASLTACPPEERLAWCLRNVEGYALEEVASACRCSLATVKRRISAADAHIRARMDVEVDK
jgi:RNA polymerase sigma-70 factor (ECF subfamily)